MQYVDPVVAKLGVSSQITDEIAAKLSGTKLIYVPALQNDDGALPSEPWIVAKQSEVVQLLIDVENARGGERLIGAHAREAIIPLERDALLPSAAKLLNDEWELPGVSLQNERVRLAYVHDELFEALLMSDLVSEEDPNRFAVDPGDLNVILDELADQDLPGILKPKSIEIDGEGSLA